MSEREPLGLGGGTPLIVLIGPNLRGVGELVASVLQERSGAILLGQATSGQPGLVGETRLSSGRSVFRVKGEILLPGGRKGAGRPIPPDVDLASGGFVDTEIWPGGDEESPEPASAKDQTEAKRPPQDRGLQRAGDLLRMIRKMPARRASIDPGNFRGQNCGSYLNA